jgi:hypothetical protein
MISNGLTAMTLESVRQQHPHRTKTMPKTRVNYSFDVLYIGEPCVCPLCGADLTDDNAVTVKSNTVKNGKPFTTCIGKDVPYEGYVLDGNNPTTTLILADNYPDVRCSACEETLQQDNHEE